MSSGSHLAMGVSPGMSGPERYGNAILYRMREHAPSACNPLEEDYRIHVRGKIIWLSDIGNNQDAWHDPDMDDIMPRARLPLRFSGGQLANGTTSVWWIVHAPRDHVSAFEVIFVDFQSERRRSFNGWRRMVAREFTAYLAPRHQVSRRQTIPRQRYRLSM